MTTPAPALHGDTAREFLVRVLGDAHEMHTVAAKWEDKAIIGLRCTCKAVIELDLTSDNGKAAQAALRNVPPLKGGK